MKLIDKLAFWRKKRGATPITPNNNEWFYLYGQSRMYWFHMREAEEADFLRCMPLRKYAKLKSLH